MAIRPDREIIPAKEQAGPPSTEQQMLMREVDDAVRQDQVGGAAKKYGLPIAAAVVLGLGAFGGWLYWQDRQEARLERASEQLVTAIDEAEAGATAEADKKLAAVASSGSEGAAAAATMLRGGLAIEQGRPQDAARFFDELAADDGAPAAYRDLATIRAVAARFNEMQPQQVIDRLKPLATPGNAWFGSAGEMVGMAYLAQGREDLAGPLFAQIAKDEDVPASLRSRVRQLAGLLGYDAVVDVDAAVAELGAQPGNAAPPAAQ